MMVERWNRNDGTVEHLLVEHWKREVKTAEQRWWNNKTFGG